MKKIIITILSIIVCTGTKAAEADYKFTLQNTSPSTIYVTNDREIADEVEIQDLERVESVALAPRESDEIDLGQHISIYTRMGKSNYKYQRHFTIAFKEELDAEEPLYLSLANLEQNELDDLPLIMINHQHPHKTPESFYALCPDGSKAKKKNNSDMYFCKITSYDEQSAQYIETYVPVIHYVYQFLPEWVWSRWYVENPILYHLYDKNPQYQAKLSSYQKPWSTQWYAQWYKKQTQSTTEHLEKPGL